MPKFNQYLTENKKPIELVQELEKHEIKKSPLSPAARGKVVNKSGSNYLSENKSGYGPMPYEGESLREDYPNIVRLFDYNRRGTINFLREKNALSSYEISHNLNFYCGSSSSDRVWSDYRNTIENYLDGLAYRLGSNGENLRQFRKELADYIHSKHYQQLPYWPSIGCENEANVNLDISGSYKSGDSHIEWSCIGWARVKSQRPNYDTYRAEFSGSPEIKLSIFDFYRLRQIETAVNYSGIEGLKRYIDQNANR